MTQSNAKVQFTFEIYSGDELVRTEELAQDIIKVGKLPSSHLRIDDEAVSRMHAYIEVTGANDVVIMDLGSATGTFVNGQKVNKGKLTSGDEVKLGNTRIKVTYRPASQAAAAPAPAPAAKPAAPAAPPAAPAAAKPAAPAAPAAPKAPAAAKPAAPNPFAAKANVVPNVFAAPKATEAAPEEEGDPSNAYYALVASAPAVDSSEVETNVPAVEVVVLWGDRDVLQVSHLSPPRAFVVGEAEGKETPDFPMEGEFLGFSRYPVTTADGGQVFAVFPAGASGDVRSGGQVKPFAQLNSEGLLGSSPALHGALQYRLNPNDQVRIKYKGFTFQVKAVPAGKKVGAGAKIDWAPLAFVGGAASFFGIVGVIGYFLVPDVGSLGGDQLDQNNRLVQYLMQPPETPPPPEQPQTNSNSQSAGGQGQRARDDEGAMGRENARRTNNRYAIQGNANPEDQQLARQNAIEQARTAGILGTLAAMTGSFNAPTSPYGGDTAIGSDPMSALGAMMGAQIGENAGFGGLGLRGTGIGGGGTGAGTIGMGTFGTIGHGGGTGDGQGYGRGVGDMRERGGVTPQVRPAGDADVRGSLSAEVIRRVVRRHMNEVRFCYEQGLNSRPDLQGRVTVRFIISPTGSVQTAMVANSSLGNGQVEGCISSAVRRWTFPSPEGGGIVIVNYPFMLTSSGG